MATLTVYHILARLQAFLYWFYDLYKKKLIFRSKMEIMGINILMDNIREEILRLKEGRNL